ncbi:MAG TPA: hypothetical protein VK737_12740 [Opitutales bacterium]|jgi:polyhydroxyalkanoate synthesis regulator phasin|nr:hypothetical protein [Opitutales bacterium]
MIDLIKKTMLAGIGATVTTKEKIEGALHEYVEKGKLSGQEAKSLADRIIADGKQEYEQARDDLGKKFQELLLKSKLATRDELAALEKRLVHLEAAHTAKHEPKSEHGTHKH